MNVAPTGIYRRDPVGESNGHKWVKTPAYGSWAYCATCGIVRRADDANLPCGGPTRMRPMENTVPAARARRRKKS